jgi:addiction module RelE/StbE family toxin
LKLIARDKIKLFVLNPKHPLLKDHKLKGEKKGLRAFHVIGDIRIVYKQITADTVLFLDVGTHNQVY